MPNLFNTLLANSGLKAEDVSRQFQVPLPQVKQWVRGEGIPPLVIVHKMTDTAFHREKMAGISSGDMVRFILERSGWEAQDFLFYVGIDVSTKTVYRWVQGSQEPASVHRTKLEAIYEKFQQESPRRVVWSIAIARMKALRADTGCSWSRLADAFGCSLPSIQGWANGVNHPRGIQDKLPKLLEILEINKALQNLSNTLSPLEN